MIFSFKQDDDEFDVVQISDDLTNFLIDKEMLSQITDSYTNSHEIGIVAFLLSLGVSLEGIQDNVHIIQSVSKKSLDDTLREYGYDDFLVDEEDRVYN